MTTATIPTYTDREIAGFFDGARPTAPGRPVTVGLDVADSETAWNPKHGGAPFVGPCRVEYTRHNGIAWATCTYELERYGFRLLDDGRFYSIAKAAPLGIVHTVTHGRHYYRNAAGDLVARGMTPVAFVQSFWFATPAEVTP